MELDNFKTNKDNDFINPDVFKRNSESLDIPLDELPVKVSNILRRNSIQKFDELMGLEKKDFLFNFKSGSIFA